MVQFIVKSNLLVHSFLVDFHCFTMKTPTGKVERLQAKKGNLNIYTLDWN